MSDIGDFIGNYKILAQLSLYPDCLLYAVEYTLSAHAPMFLISCPTLILISYEEQSRFLQKARNSSIEKNGQTISIQDAGVIDRHPYFVLARNNETQHFVLEYTRLVAQILASTRSLHPNDQRTLFEAFLQVFVSSTKTENKPMITPLPVSQSGLGKSIAQDEEDEEEETEKTRVVRPSMSRSSVRKSVAQDEEKTVLTSPPSLNQSGPANLALAEEKTILTPPLLVSSIAPVEEKVVVTPPPLSNSFPSEEKTVLMPPSLYEGGLALAEEKTVLIPPSLSQSGLVLAEEKTVLTPPILNQSGLALTEEKTVLMPPSPEQSNFALAEEWTVLTPPALLENRFANSSSYASSSFDASNVPHTSGTAFANTASHTAKQKLKTWQIAVAVVLALVLLIGGGSWLHTVIPAAAATVSITPAKTDFSHTYTLMVTTGATGYNGGNVSVQGRQVSAKSPQEIQTVIATGRGLHPAIAAKGSVVVSQIHLTVISPTGNSLAVSSIPDGDGRSITTDEEVPISDGATVTIPAHATVAGSGGNLPAHDLDGPIQIVDAMNNSPIGTAYVANPAAFTGGQDATSYVFVQQSDIDNAAKAMTAQLTPGMKEQVQAQIHKDDLLVHAIACTSDTGADHKANDEAANVTVKVTVSCNTLVYTAQTLHDAAVKAYQSDGSARFGSGYGVVGDIVAGKPAPADEGVFTMQIDGIWSYQYTQAHLQEIKSLIAGKKSGDALKLLQARKDIQHVSLTTSGGLGTAVPTALDNIQLHVATVTGLHA